MTSALLRRLASTLAAATVGITVLAACSSSYDAGRTAQEQLCNVLESTLSVAKGTPGFSFEAELEGAARDPVDMPASLVAINLGFRTHESSYDRLGRYEPAIRFAADLVDLSSKGLIGPSTLSPRVLGSAQRIDQALGRGACR